MRGHGGEVLEALNVLLERPDAQLPTRIRARALTVGCRCSITSAAIRRGRTLSQADAIALATMATEPEPGAVPAIIVPAGQAAPDGSAGSL